MRYYLLTALLIAACVPPPALGGATQKAFAAQAQSGQRPDGASHLSTAEIRKIMGTDQNSNSGINVTKTITGGNTQTKEPINAAQ